MKNVCRIMLFALVCVCFVALNYNIADAKKKKVKTKIETGVIFEENGIVVEADKLKDNGKNMKLEIIVTNNNDYDIIVDIKDFCINNVLTQPIYHYQDDKHYIPKRTLKSKSKIKLTLLENSKFIQNHLTDIKELEFVFIYQKMEEDAEITTNILKIKTNKFDKLDYYSMDKQNIVYEDNDIDVYLTKTEDNNYLYLSIYKKTDEIMGLNIKDLKINGWMNNYNSNRIGGYDIKKGYYNILDIYITDSFLKKNKIKSIENVNATLVLHEDLSTNETNSREIEVKL